MITTLSRYFNMIFKRTPKERAEVNQLKQTAFQRMEVASNHSINKSRQAAQEFGTIATGIKKTAVAEKIAHAMGK